MNAKNITIFGVAIAGVGTFAYRRVRSKTWRFWNKSFWKTPAASKKSDEKTDGK